MVKIQFNTIKVLIIGNGFDLNQDFDTSYTNYINSQYFSNILNKNNNPFAKHLHQKNQLKNWIDIENELKLFSKTYGGRLDGVKFKQYFNEISDSLVQYLKSIDFKNIKKDKYSYKFIKDIVLNSDNSLNTPSYLILDFNYTPTLEYILRDLKVSENSIEQRLIKIHGSISDNSIIFGTEDSSDVINEHTFLLKTSSIFSKGIDFTTQLNAAQEIHFFGHSLGDTDHFYFKDFFKRHINPAGIRPKKLIHHYYDSKGYDDFQISIRKLTDNNLGKFKQIVDFIAIDVNAEK